MREIIEREIRDVYAIEREAKAKRKLMQRCPVCGVYNEFITNVHCVREHGRTKKDIEAEFGKIINEENRLKLVGAK